jgi:hypothetical protein
MDINSLGVFGIYVAAFVLGKKSILLSALKNLQAKIYLVEAGK